MITLDSIHKSFRNHTALENLCLKVASGDIYGLLGANGAGKSTTLNLVLGFLQADSGTIHMTHPEHDSTITSNEIGYIPENVQLYPYLSGLENLEYFCTLAGRTYSQIELSNFLTTCGLQREAHEQRTSEYSKGMRQKVGIAIAMAKQAKVYLLDEPASGLDPLASNELSTLLKNLAADGAAILMASHDLFRVRETCTRIGILKRGRLVKEILSNDVTSKELEDIYLNFMKD
ncbi:MAG: ABC transporter ATP-binding protein [Deltaproteobacteria bacterium]|nr:ABC transporter ATP-binding protein [Deltaproteobacteria bacterium]